MPVRLAADRAALQWPGEDRLDRTLRLGAASVATRSRTRTALHILRPLFIHAQQVAAQFLAIQTGDGGTRLVTFHFDEAETAALAGEHIVRKLDRAYAAVRGEQLGQLLLGRVGRQIAGVDSFHDVAPRVAFYKLSARST